MPQPSEHAESTAAQGGPAAALTLETALSAAAAAPAAPVATPGPGGLLARLRRPPGLRAGLWLLLAIGLLPALAGSVWYLLQLREQAVRDAYAQADLMAGGTSAALGWMLQDGQALMVALASRPRVRALDSADCDPMLRDFRALSPVYTALSLRRRNGELVCSELSNPPTRETLLAAPWFQAALRQDGFRASDVHQGLLTQAWTARLSVPVLGTSGQPEGLLVSLLDLQQLHRRLLLRLPAQARVAVVDGSNQVLLQSQRPEERVGQPASAGLARAADALRQQARAAADPNAVVHQLLDTGFDGSRRLFVLRMVPLSDWVVIASLPQDLTLQRYHANRNRALVAALLVLLLVALAAWRVGRGILLPIRGLARATRGVAAGDDSQRAPEAGPREIAAVAREFNRMVLANSLARAQLAASEHHYRTLIQNLPVAVVTHRPDGAIELFNDRACGLLRMRPDQLQGRSTLDQAWAFVDLQGQRLAPQSYPVSRLLQGRQPLAPMLLGIVGQPDSLAVHAAAEPHTWVMVTGYPQFDSPGQLQRVIVVFVDVTAQRQAEALRLARDTAEAASKAKSVFLSRASHELRTPLNAINGFTELVLMDAQVPAASKDKLGHVLNAGRHLLSLINQMLDLTQVETVAQTLPRQPLALWPVLADCVALCGPLAQARAVVVQLPPEPADPPWVLGGATPLRQVLINLLSNAIKYNRRGGSVRISLAAAADGMAWAVSVQDTGPGLSAVQQAALFQPFNRLGAEFSGVEGHGLGLSIARQLAQAMGGDIGVHSEAGQGATFTLRLLRAAPGD